MEIDYQTLKHATREKYGPKIWVGGGLYLELHKNGAKYWRLKYRFNGKEKRLALGVFDTVSIVEAKEKRDEAKKILSQGKDPLQERKKDKAVAQQNSENTFEAIALEWYENRKDIWKPRYADEVIKRLKEDIFPEIGSYPIKEIEPPLLLQTIRKIEARGAYDLAKRQLQKCGEICR